MTGTANRRLRLIDATGDDRAAIRIAIATDSTGLIDATFGKATLLAVDEVAADVSRLIEMVQFDQPPNSCSGVANDNPDDCEDRVEARLAALDGCHLIFARRIGDADAAPIARRKPR